MSPTFFRRVSVVCSMTVLYSVLTAAGGRRTLPSFSGPISNQTAQLNKHVTLACSVHHLGKYRVAWLHLDRQTLIAIGERLITQLPRYTVYHDRYKTWYLRIHHINRLDAGAYMCQINTKPMIHQKGYIRVVEPPRIVDNSSSPSDVAVHESGSVTLHCEADGEPAPRISWRREDEAPVLQNGPDRVYNGSSLKLVQVTRALMGTYLCIANNGIPPSPSKLVRLQVQFAPSVLVESEMYGPAVGSSVTLRCRTQAHPRPINYWTHSGNILLQTHNKYNIAQVDDGYRTMMKLTVFNIAKSDFGIYRCISKNALGEAEAALQIFVSDETTDRGEDVFRRPPLMSPGGGWDQMPEYSHNSNSQRRPDGESQTRNTSADVNSACGRCLCSMYLMTSLMALGPIRQLFDTMK